VTTRSILDVVTDQIRRLQQGLPTRDRAKIDQYVEAIRDIERRIQMAEDQSGRELPWSSSRPACRRRSKNTPG